MGLEREQEALVEQIRLQAVPRIPQGGADAYVQSLEAKALELQEALERATTSCQEQEAKVWHLRRSAEDAQQSAEVLKQSYEALQQNSDDRTTRSDIGAMRTPPKSSPMMTASSITSTIQSFN